MGDELTEREAEWKRTRLPYYLNVRKRIRGLRWIENREAEIKAVVAMIARRQEAASALLAYAIELVKMGLSVDEACESTGITAPDFDFLKDEESLLGELWSDIELYLDDVRCGGLAGINLFAMLRPGEWAYLAIAEEDGAAPRSPFGCS